jgi:hypothetical protein
MSVGEERVYQTLWHGRESDGIFIESSDMIVSRVWYGLMNGAFEMFSQN